MKRRSLVIAALALVLVIVCGGVYWFWLRGADETIATITLDGEKIAEYDLSRVRTTEIMTVGEPGAENTIRVSPDGIAVIHADCPDQVCVNQGVRSHGPQPIVCLPHKLSITFSEASGNNAVDAVAGQ